MAAPGIPAPGRQQIQKRTCEDPGKTIQKKPKISTTIGYKGKTLLKYKPYSVAASTGIFPKNHILRKDHGENGVEEILKNILSTKTGFTTLSHVTPEYVLTNSSLGDHIAKILKKMKKTNFMKFAHILKEDKLRVEKKKKEYKKMDSEEILILLKMSPFCRDKTAVEDEIMIEDHDVIAKNAPLSHNTVFVFLREVLQTLVPMSVWGSQENFSTMENFMHKMIDMGAYDTITIGRLLDKIRMADIRWAEGHPPLERSYVVSKFFVWILEQIIIVTVKSFFYPTKMSGGGYQIFYFPKNKMESLFQKTVNSICEILPSNSESRGTLKLLPKKSGGVRPLFREVKEKVIEPNKYHHARLILRYLAFREHNILPSAPFSELWHNAVTKVGKEGMLYFVKTDIKDAFSSVDVQKLLELLHFAVKDINFLKFKKYCGGRNGIYIPLDDIREPIYLPISKGKVLKEASTFTINVKEMMSLIEVSLQPCVLYGKLKVKIAEGLPQGSCLSSDLCNFYYARMTSLHLDDIITSGNGALLRTADDFLYISRSLQSVEQFRFRMMRGYPDFNCYINKEKTLTNTTCQINRLCFNGYVICLVSKCILINVSGLASVPVRFSQTCNNVGNMQKFVVQKLFQITGSRLPYHLISHRISSLHTVLDNVWRLGIICGAKVNALVSYACEVSGQYNSSVFAKAVLGVMKKIFKRIKHNRGDDFLGENIFISLVICSFSYSVNVKSVKNKLRIIAMKNLEKVNDKREQKLKEYLEYLLK